MKCQECKYCKYNSAGYWCEHRNVVESAKEYEKLKHIKIQKSVYFIGFRMVKTRLRWCPLK